METAKIGVDGIPEIGFEGRSHLREFLFGPRPHRTLARVLVWSILGFCFFHNLLVPIQIIGSSMNPTYQNGSLNLVNKWSYSTGAPHRGDVIAVRVDGELLLKRIVAVSGESIRIDGGRIMINNHSLQDQFSRRKIPWEMDPIQLGPNEYFVIGDNRAASLFCKVKRDQILGKIIF
jgi:signal peptidase I